MNRIGRALALVASLALSQALVPGLALAEDAAASVPEEALDPALKEVLAREKEARKACKIDICSILRSKKAEGPDVGCHVIKTWPKADLTKLVEKAHVSWPWGNTICETDVKLKRATLVAAMTEATYEAALDEHVVTCEIDRGAEGEKYKLKLTMTPKISFESGKAVKAVVNWGELEAPSVAKGVLWPATALDNQLNVLSGEVVEAVNKFAGEKCDEVKAELRSE